MFYLGRAVRKLTKLSKARMVGADKRGLHASSTGDIELNSFVEASSQTQRQRLDLWRGRLRKQEKENL